MGVADHPTAQGRADGVVDLVVADLQCFQALAVRNQAQARAGAAVAVVDVDDIGHGVEDRLHALGHAAAGRRVRSVDLGQQGGHDGRPRGRLDHLDHGALRQGEAGQPPAQIQGDGVAVAATRVLRRQPHRQIAHLGLVPQIVVTHEAVEIEGRSGSGIGVDRGDLGQRAGDERGVGQGALGGFQRGPLGHVEHHLQLGLVVERQQLHGHGLGGEHGAGDQGGDADPDQEGPGAPACGDDACGDAAIQAPQRALVVRVRRMAGGQGLAGEAHHQPGGDDHGDEEREHHGGRGVDRDRRHVGAHQP